IAHQRDALAGQKPREHLGRARGLVVLVVGDEARTDAVAAEEDLRAAGVLAEHDVRLAELPQHAQRDVLEVPDRRRADDERHAAAAAPSSASKATRPAPTRPAAVPSSARTIRTSSRAGGSASRATSA